MFSFSSFSFFSPTYKYLAEQLDPATGSAWYLTLSIINFDAEKGQGQFEIVWIEGLYHTTHTPLTLWPDRNPQLGSTLPETREIVTTSGKVEATTDGIYLSSSFLNVNQD